MVDVDDAIVKRCVEPKARVCLCTIQVLETHKLKTGILNVACDLRVVCQWHCVNTVYVIFVHVTTVPSVLISRY
jgi:hypothetical protein